MKTLIRLKTTLDASNKSNPPNKDAIKYVDAMAISLLRSNSASSTEKIENVVNEAQNPVVSPAKVLGAEL